MVQKKIEVRVNHKYGTAGLLPGLPKKAIWNCDVLKTLLWIGILTAPPRYRGFDLSTFWAWLRYASAISELDSGLSLKPIWSEVDTHQMTVMSDDFGMGFSCHYLAEQHGIQAFANTSYLLDSLFGVAALRPSKRGPAKSPDFIGVDANGHLHILECKGTQSSQQYLIQALEAGICQKNNFTNGTIFSSCMVGGVFVPQHTSKEDALLMYIDPELDKRIKQLAGLPRSVIEGRIYRISLAKELMAAGLWRTASSIERRGQLRDCSDSNQVTIKAELPLAGFSEESGIWRRQLEYRSIEVDSTRKETEKVTKEYSRLTTLNLEVNQYVIRFVHKVQHLDSLGKHDFADALILRRAKFRMKRRSAWIRSRPSEGAPITKERQTIESVWDEHSFNETSASLIGSSDIRFILSREDGG